MARAAAGTLFRQDCKERRKHRRAKRPRLPVVAIERLETRVLLSAGILDTSFGDGGHQTVAFQGLKSRSDFANDVVIQSNGQIIVAGSSDQQFALVRYNTDGSVDTAFGSNGRVRTNFGNGTLNAVTLQSDGKIIAVGQAGLLVELQFDVVRYNTDGSLDTSFDTDGRASVGTFNITATSVVVQPDGKIVVGGFALNELDPGDHGRYYEVVRLNPDGSPDTSFGTTFSAIGAAVAPVTASIDFAYPPQVLLQADGKIVLAGETSTAGSTQFFVMRFNGDGSVDTTFDGDGESSMAIANLVAGPAQAALQPDGKIVMVGTTAANTVVARFNTNGSPDLTFDGDGQATPLSFDHFTAAGIVVQPDGHIMGLQISTIIDELLLFRLNANGSLDTSFDGDGYAGAVWNASASTRGTFSGGLALQSNGSYVTVQPSAPASSSDFSVARFLANGTYDPSFSGGIIFTDFTFIGTVDSQIDGIAVRPDGKIMAIAADISSNQQNFLVASYNPDGSPNTGFGGTGTVAARFARGKAVAKTLVVQPDGKTVVAGIGTSVDFGDQDIAVARFNLDGTLDTTFGGDGKVTTQIDVTNEIPASVLIQPDGKIVVAAILADSGIVLVRYNADGSADTTFGTNGVVQTTIGQSATVAGVVLQPDGKLVVAGTEDSQSGQARFVAFRYLTNGGLDSSFGTAGEFRSDPLAQRGGQIHAVALQSDGKIVAGGQFRDAIFASGFGETGGTVLFRVTSSGVLDETFGNHGSVVRYINAKDGVFNYHSAIYTIAIQPDGKILTAGTGPITLTRYNTSGALDQTFGGVIGPKTFGGFPFPEYGAGGDISIPFGGNFVGFPAISTVHAMTLQDPARLLVGLTPGYGALYTEKFSSILRYSLTGLTVSATNVLTDESGATGTFTVKLDQQPSGNVTIPLNSTNTAEGTVAPAFLVFTPQNYNLPQMVTVTGVDDAVRDSDQEFKVNVGQFSSNDPAYNGFDPDVKVGVTNFDNESLRMFRAYNPNAAYHFFTTSRLQFENAVNHGYNDETSGRSGFSILPTAENGAIPLFRLYNFQTGRHYYTVSEGERDYLVSLIPTNHPQYGTVGWRYEGVEGYMYSETATGGTVLIYRLYNMLSGAHLFTESVGTRNVILASFPGIWVEHSPLGYGFVATIIETAYVPPQSTPAVAAAVMEPVAPVRMTTDEQVAGATADTISIVGVATNTAMSAVSMPPPVDEQLAALVAPPPREESDDLASPEALDEVFAMPASW